MYLNNLHNSLFPVKRCKASFAGLKGLISAGLSRAGKSGFRGFDNFVRFLCNCLLLIGICDFVHKKKYVSLVFVHFCTF